MKSIYWGCELIFMAVQVWSVLGMIAVISEPKREKMQEVVIKSLISLLAAALNSYSNSLGTVLFSNAMLLIIMLIIVVSSKFIYRCKCYDVFYIVFIFMTSIAIGDFFIQTCAYFVLKQFNLPVNYLLIANTFRGIYLLLYAGFIWWGGKKIKDWLSMRGEEINHFRRGSCFVLIILAFCLVYFQRIYKLNVPDVFMFQWWLFILSIVVIILLSWGKNIKKKDDEQLRILKIKTEMWEEGYQRLSQLQEERRIQQHDMVHHLCMIREMLAAEKRDELQEYVEKLTGDLKMNKEKYSANHKFLDLVLNRKLHEAEEEKIQVEFSADDMSDLQLNSTDICALFCNLLDNAIEANEKRKYGEQRWLRLKCARDGDMLIVLQSNLFGGDMPRIEDGRFPETTKTDKRLHGCGMRSIQQVLDKYNGYMRINIKGDIFTIVIFLVGFSKS